MKKTGYIIYQPSETERNMKFVEMFQKAGKQYGLEFVLGTRDSCQSLPLPDFILNRTRDYRVSQYYEERNIPVFHCTELVRMGNDKAETLDVLRENWQGAGMPCIPESLILLPEDSMGETVFWEKINAWQEKHALEERPFVIKTVDGHGGQEVFLLEKNQHYIAALAGRKLLCQQMIESDSRDVRVYVLGGEIYSAVLRQGRGDFRSNYSLGGKVSEYSLSQEQYREVQKYIECLGGKKLFMAGIDFLINRQGNLVFNELEEMVGSRMLYACTDKDIVQDYVALLARTV